MNKAGRWLIEKKARKAAIKRAWRDCFVILFPASVLALLMVVYAEVTAWLMTIFLIAVGVGIMLVSYNTHYQICYKMYCEEAEKEENKCEAKTQYKRN